MYSASIQYQNCDGKTDMVLEADQHKHRCQNGRDKKTKDITAWSHDMQGHAQKCVKRFWELADKTIDQLHKVSTPCSDDQKMNPENLEIVRELSETCSRIVLQCLHLGRIGRPDLLLTVNDVARPVTKWNRARDLRLARLISYIHHTTNYRQYCHVGNQAIDCTLGIFPRRRLCRKIDRLKVNLRWCSVCIWITYVCADFMNW